MILLLIYKITKAIILKSKRLTGPPWWAFVYFDRVYCRYCQHPWCSLLCYCGIVKIILPPFAENVNLDDGKLGK